MQVIYDTGTASVLASQGVWRGMRDARSLGLASSWSRDWRLGFMQEGENGGGARRPRVSRKTQSQASPD